jgi:transcriptional regulator of acetoin/glycerol metabolism
MREELKHAARVESALANADPARSVLAASWMRSAKLHGLSATGVRGGYRLTQHEFARIREEDDLLIRAAAPSLDRLAATLGGFGTSVLLANRDGIAIERRGQSADDSYFEDAGLWAGTDWSEAMQGTNGIGTVIAEGRSVNVHREQHFHARNIGLSCMGAPIFDAEGRLAGVLDISSAREAVTPAVVELIGFTVSEAARRIESDVFRLSFPNARIVMLPQAEKSGGALLAVGKDDLVIGATRTARRHLRIDGNIAERRLVAADLLSEAPATSLAEGERAVLVQALARAGGNVSAAARALSISRATLHRKLVELQITESQSGERTLSQN